MKIKVGVRSSYKVQLVEYLPSMKEPQVQPLTPHKLSVVGNTHGSSTQTSRWRQEDQKANTILGFIVSSRTARALYDCLNKKKIKVSVNL